MDVTTRRPSFQELADEHERLAERFLDHQEALLRLDTLGALEKLVEFEAALVAHMRMEEEILLPVYRRAGAVPRGDEAMFVGEHKRMLRLLAKHKEALRRLEGTAAELRLGILEILDEESLFKRLVKHHNEREHRVLYPTLDRLTEDAERSELLRRCQEATDEDDA